MMHPSSWRTVVLILSAATLVIAGRPALAQGNAVDAYVMRLTPEDLAQVVALLSDCGGIYAAFGDVATVQAPDLADDYREMQNGALVAAAYLLYREHLLRTRIARPFTDFVPAVKARAETRAAQVKASFAANDLDQPKTQLGECAKLEDLQSMVVRSWREEMRPE